MLVSSLSGHEQLDVVAHDVGGIIAEEVRSCLAVLEHLTKRVDTDNRNWTQVGDLVVDHVGVVENHVLGNVFGERQVGTRGAEITRADLFDGELHGEFFTGLLQPPELSHAVNDALYTGTEVVGKVGVMVLRVLFWHQHLDVGSDDVSRVVPEAGLCRAVEPEDGSQRVDGNHGDSRHLLDGCVEFLRTPQF